LPMNMLTNSKRKNDAVLLLMLSGCFLFAEFLFSYFTSPIFPYTFGDDSAIFSLMGKGVTEGKILYTDLFDHKGPMNFFINALGHFLWGRTGIFILQCCSGLCAITALYYCGKILRPNGEYRSALECFLLFFIGFSSFIYSMQGGNLTEEYSVSFIAIALYFIVKYASNVSNCTLHPPGYAFVYGVCFALLAFLRLNNAVTVCAGVLPILLYLLWKKEYKNVLLNVLCGILGILLVAVPIVLYFHAHSALEEMINAAFLHNFKIVDGQSHLPLSARPLKYVALYLPLLLSLGLIAMHLRKNKAEFLDIVLSSILLFNLLNLWIANRFEHYFLLYVPVYITVLHRYFTLNGKAFLTKCIAVCTALNILLAGAFLCARIYEYIDGEIPSRYTAVHTDMQRIPEQERDSVIGYDIRSSDYLYGDITPCYKYYTLQEGWSLVNPQILTDFMAYLRGEDRPLWVITNPQEDNEELLEILSDLYALQFENDYLVFYRVK